MKAFSGSSPRFKRQKSAHARAMPLLSVCGVFSWPKHFDPQSGLAVGCFVVVNWAISNEQRYFPCGRPDKPKSLSGNSDSQSMVSSVPSISTIIGLKLRHHKASLGPEWAALNLMKFFEDGESLSAFGAFKLSSSFSLGFAGLTAVSLCKCMGGRGVCGFVFLLLSECYGIHKRFDR